MDSGLRVFPFKSLGCILDQKTVNFCKIQKLNFGECSPLTEPTMIGTLQLNDLSCLSKPVSQYLDEILKVCYWSLKGRFCPL